MCGLAVMTLRVSSTISNEIQIVAEKTNANCNALGWSKFYAGLRYINAIDPLVTAQHYALCVILVAGWRTILYTPRKCNGLDEWPYHADYVNTSDSLDWLSCKVTGVLGAIEKLNGCLLRSLLDVHWMAACFGFYDGLPKTAKLKCSKEVVMRKRHSCWPLL